MILEKISHAIHPYRKFLVGFSGGLDSTVLLYCLKLLRDKQSDIKLRAIYVHHGLSSKADSWEKHCVKLCHNWKIPLVTARVSIEKKGLNIEAKARNKRYLAFKDALLPNESLVIAHNLDDQCETFFLALKRGSGPAGLSSMSQRSKFFNTQLLRPLLHETRESLVCLAKMYALQWIEDESNQNDDHDRNFFRLRIIPLLKKRWSYIHTVISRSANLCAEQENLLDELLSDDLFMLTSPEGGLKIAPLINVSTLKRSALLRRWLANQGALMPSRAMLNRIWKEVALANKHSLSPCIRLNDYEIRRFRGLLWKVQPEPILSDSIFLWKNLYQPLILPKGIGRFLLRSEGQIPLPTQDNIVSVRFQSSGRVCISGHHGVHDIKNIWKKFNIFPWKRSTTPLLFYDDMLISIAETCVCIAEKTQRGISFEKG